SRASSALRARRMPFSSSTMRTRPGISAALPTSRRQRQGDRELGAAAGLADDVDGALVRLDDLARDRHAEPGALVLGGEERIEDAADLVGRNTAAVVAQAHH